MTDCSINWPTMQSYRVKHSISKFIAQYAFIIHRLKCSYIHFYFWTNTIVVVWTRILKNNFNDIGGFSGKTIESYTLYSISIWERIWKLLVSDIGCISELYIDKNSHMTVFLLAEIKKKQWYWLFKFLDNKRIHIAIYIISVYIRREQKFDSLPRR